jgi:tetratricopeptide (TPR) repeat protein
MIQEKWQEAIHFFSKAVKIDLESGLYWKGLADAEAKMGNYIAAHEAYAEASEMDEENPEVWLDWSLLYYEQGDFEAAQETVENGLSEIPDSADLFYRSVVYLIEAGKYQMAVNQLETALILDFDGHTQLYDFLPNLQTQKGLFKIIDQYRKNN